jgi:GT2 family glycosyltransferase
MLGGTTILTDGRRTPSGGFVTSLPDKQARGSFAGAGAHADAAVIMVTYNSASHIPQLIDDLRAAGAERSLRVIVIDNQSADGTAEVVRAHPDIELVEAGGNLGYAGGINVALPLTDPCDGVLILNPDLRVKPNAVDQLLDVLVRDDTVGAVVPRILDMDETPYPSLRHEPSITRLLGDALFGSKLWRGRPGFLSEFDYRPESYQHARDIEWATGAALLIRSTVAREVGEWNEEFFLFSEETDYFRRIRESGYAVRFEPSAVVQHELGGSGTASPALAPLLAVNRIRYAELYHGSVYSTGVRAAVALAEVLRSYNPVHRRTLAIVLSRSRWRGLPAATKPVVAEPLSGPLGRGSVIIPAYNEAAVIERTLAPLSQAALDGYIELIVVCNGCTDDTAQRARNISGAQVVELDVGSKPLALNTGDDLATQWPRMYLDADIEITAAAVVAVLDRLGRGDVLAARPAFRYGTEGASALVRSYYRARTRMNVHQNALWWAGVYALSEQGHRRFGSFPEVTGDDLFVDTQFDLQEKTVVQVEPSVWRTPSDARGLLTVLGRHHRGNAELATSDPAGAPRTGTTTAIAVARTVRGPRSAVDAAVYVGMALGARWRAARSAGSWERDDTSRGVDGR